MAVSGHVLEVNLDNFQEAVVGLSRKVLVLVDFWAPWCAPCRALGPVLEKLAEEMGGAFVLAKVNSDENADLSRQYQVRGIPAVKAFKDGKVVDEFTGALPESAVRQFIEKNLPLPGDDLRVQALDAIAQGKAAEAEALLEQAISIYPGNDPARVALAHLAIQQGRHADAQAQIDAMSPTFQMETEVEGLKALLEFTETARSAPSMTTLEATIASEKGDLRAQAMYQRSLLLLLQGQEEAALDQLIEMVERHKNYQDGLARKTVLKIFALQGNRGPLVERYRSRLSRALH
ncbi:MULTISPECIES: thioredoxin [Acidithiobacillus]|uniref:Thioredoxin n=1 Tax=Acidithiobacillus ferruginosus TaxID=3063951 RepID=A0ACD5IGJ2_9PROT|nr:thioredoxin [Acidithiobacillus ferruginosus]MBU2814421.1 thioredoxin [Acidithiobacillus ferruginosus]